MNLFLKNKQNFHSENQKKIILCLQNVSVFDFLRRLKVNLDGFN